MVWRNFFIDRTNCTLFIYTSKTGSHEFIGRHNRYGYYDSRYAYNLRGGIQIRSLQKSTQGEVGKRSCRMERIESPCKRNGLMIFWLRFVEKNPPENRAHRATASKR